MDSFTREKRSFIMSCVKSTKNLSTEVLLISLFRENSIHGWRRNFKLIGHPDFVFPEKRVAVFVDGCFWHGCKNHLRLPTTNRSYWTNKILNNIKRDKRFSNMLKKLNWKVIRIWEHELKNKKIPARLLKLI